MEENNEVKNTVLYLVNVIALNKAFYFQSDIKDLEINDNVVVETTRGQELGKVIKLPTKEEGDNSSYPNLLRRASNIDLELYEKNLETAKTAKELTQNLADKMNLGMKILTAEYTIDVSKVIITYLSDERVDFRELLKELSTVLHCRVELKQIGIRDKAKMIGGIGICGLPLCCSTFLNEFDGISITMAKNQMLALNIPKLSGHCGKLICCLKFENDAYTDLQKDLPKIGSRVKYEGGIYKISSMNVITKMIRIENKENAYTLPYDTIKDFILSKEEFMKLQEERRKDEDEANQEG